LPKGTEQFMSDLHGEHRAFLHIMNSCSGVIRDKIELVFGHRLTSAEKRELATLIYYPEEYLERAKEKHLDINEWYAEMLTRLVGVCHSVTHKYSRSKVRKALPKDFAYIIDELLHTSYVETDRINYYENIILSIIELDRADAFIIAMAELIKRMAVDRLHIVGDIYDRGARADVIVDKLMTHHSVDIQWGNHDVLWLGAAAGSMACIAVAVKNCLQYDMLYMLENSYGISLLPLAIYASETYEYSKVFEPRVKPKHGYQPRDEGLYAKMHKAISVIMYKLEGQIVKRNPEFQMTDRVVLEHIDYDDMTFIVNGEKYELRDTDFPTIDRNDPLALTPDEEELMEKLREEFMGSYKLQKHIDYLYYSGAVYKVYNNNLLYHCCIPTNPDGSRMTFEFEGEKYSGKALLDYCDKVARQAFYAPEGSYSKEYGCDFLWFLWCGRHSPIFGKDCIKTFERELIGDESTWKEPKNSYYRVQDSEEFFEGILEEFGNKEICLYHIENG
ncbi:MAG: fructose-1,6-bisphosphatase, partial [Clostridiales bacterium]|nr:fructose-1,6-bisphosphatase [Clostridiales bacterium]